MKVQRDALGRNQLVFKDGRIVTEVESHPASISERWQVFKLVWDASGSFDVPVDQRRKARRFAVKSYLLTRKPYVSRYSL